MTTDWVLIQRAAAELDRRLRGSRVLDAGQLPDGRVAVSLRARNGPVALVADLFGSPPTVTLEDAALPIAVEPGFIRKLVATLRGMTVTAVRSRRGDRVLRVEFGSRSRFGVGDSVDLILELVPRFGNAVLVKRDVVVAAAKEFTLAENPARAVQTGHSYVPPPLPATIKPPLESVGDDALSAESALAVLAELRAKRLGDAGQRGAEQRRQALARRLSVREEKLRAELRSLENKRRDAEARFELRDEGERIFSSLHELDESARDEAKERAAKLFARYKKLQASLEHVTAREVSVARALDAVEVLRWEADRAAEEDLDDVERATAELEPRGARESKREGVKKGKRKPLEFRTEGGSRIVVGRSPTENADVTFRQARPDDLWFHAQGIPGAHVVLARDDRSPPPDEDIEIAAALAAYHSKGRASAKVSVDYTLRKFVRKQQDAPPGLVWYTHPKTVLAEPITEDALRRLSNRRS
jgi:predicted ribosome quality control (RQC) complex YloA/Tae2 family protein